MVSGTLDKPPLEATLSTAHMSRETASLQAELLIDSRLFITLIEESNWCKDLFFLVSLGHSITVGFAELISASLIRISALDP